MSNVILMISRTPERWTDIHLSIPENYELWQVESYVDARNYLASNLNTALILITLSTPEESLNELLISLRSSAEYADLPVFILSQANQHELIHYAYSIGANDYLNYPCDPTLLLFRIEALIASRQRVKCISEEYETRLQEATQIALAAMRSSSDIGTIVNFVHESSKFSSYQEIAKQVLAVISSLGLVGCVEIRMDDESLLLSSSGSPSAFEREIIETGRNKRRIISKAKMALFNYPGLSLLVKNLPIESPEVTGRYHDLLCQLADAAQTRVRSLRFENVVLEQSFRATGMVELIRQKSHDNLVHMHGIVNKLYSRIQESLNLLGLSEAQEEIILNMIEASLSELDYLHENNVALEAHCIQMANEMQQVLASSGRKSVCV